MHSGDFHSPFALLKSELNSFFLLLLLLFSCRLPLIRSFLFSLFFFLTYFSSCPAFSPASALLSRLIRPSFYLRGGSTLKITHTSLILTYTLFLYVRFCMNKWCTQRWMDGQLPNKRGGVTIVPQKTFLEGHSSYLLCHISTSCDIFFLTFKIEDEWRPLTKVRKERMRQVHLLWKVQVERKQKSNKK